MRRSLLLKFILGYILFAALSFGFLAVFATRYAYRNCLTDEARRVYGYALQLADDCSDLYHGETTIDVSALHQLTWLSNYLEADIWIMDNKGLVVFDSAGIHTGNEISEFNPTETPSIYRVGDFYEAFKEQRLSVVAPITANFHTYGYVSLHEPLTLVEAASNRLTIPMYVTFLVVFLASFIILIIFIIYVFRPLKKITAAANEYAAGNLKYELKVNSHDEIGYLANTLNTMAQDLSRTEEYQRQFISNISHDFRSPLTSIKGYLEAMKDGVIPPEQQDKYIDIVINEADRLTGLTQNMLQLNSLSNPALQLEMSVFDINPVIRDTCASFEGTCIGRDISIDLTFSAEELMVYADRSRIQQVLYNLLDNAIKFSSDGSSIAIESFSRADKVFVSVKDTGVGIPKENLKLIWTRFYKGDESRGKNKKGTGLGLSIVKEIITAHGENIDVISTEGVGTEFIFSLAAAE